MEPNRLLAGEYPSSWRAGDPVDKLERIRAAGVTFFLDLTEHGELEAYAELVERGDAPFEHRRLAVRDYSVPSEDEMMAILDTIDGALADGHVVYLHCWGGVGRTGTAVACWLVRHGTPPDEALRRVQAWIATTPNAHRRSPETDEQAALVRRWRAGR